jgi:putative MATE family efflux protein
MLAVPMVMEKAMESIFAVADVFWVAHLGADAVATVGLTESMMTMIYTAALGLSIGATALVARRTGEHDPEGAALAAGQSVVLGLLIAAALGVVAAPFAPALLRLMGATDDVVRTGSGFTRMMVGGNATVLLLFLQNAVFRGAGDAAIAMRVLVIGNLLNIVLGPCFIFGIGPFPRLGVTGAAVATNIGRGAAVIYQFALLIRGTGRVRLTTRHLRLNVPVMRAVLKLSGSGTFQILVGTASYVGLVRILSTFGSSALAGYTIGIRVILFALLPAFGISNAASTIVGQNLGA